MSVTQRVLFTLSVLLLPQSAWALSCSASIGNVNFGAVNVLSGTNPLATSSSPVAINCSRGLFEAGGNATVCVYLGDGSGGWDGGTQRFMRSGTNPLGYNLYKDAARSQIWGSLGIFGASGPKRYVFNVPGGLAGGSATQNDTIYASINPGQSTASVGNYSSSFTAPHTLVRFANGNVVCPGSGDVRISTFDVTASVTANCSISAQDLNFGVAPSLPAARDQNTSINVACTNAAPWSVGLSNGSNFSGTRRMRLANTASYIGYGLFRNAARTQAWGTGANAANGTGTGGNQTLTVFGRVPAQATPAAGTFVDTVVATITF